MSIKKLFLMALVVAFLAVPVLWSTALHNQPVEAAPNRQDTPPTDSITVTGSGLAYGAPDIAHLGLGVEAANQDIMAAMNDANTSMDAVIQALQDAGVAPDDIRTENFSVYQDRPYVPDASGADQPSTYRVSNTVTVTVRDTSKVAELLSTAVASGANVVNYMQFDIANRGELESQARDLAVADAQSRAEQLAATLGLSVGRPLNVVENSGSYSPMYAMGGGGGGMVSNAPAISQGTLSVSMAVTITFALE